MTHFLTPGKVDFAVFNTESYTKLSYRLIDQLNVFQTKVMTIFKAAQFMTNVVNFP